MLGDILKRVDAILRDHHEEHEAKSMALPDSWVLTPTNITMGDVRALVARVRECEATVADEKRRELVQVATAIFAANFDTMSAEVAQNNASDLIDACEGFALDQDDILLGASSVLDEANALGEDFDDDEGEDDNGDLA